VSKLLAFGLLGVGAALGFVAYRAQTDALHSPHHAAAQVGVAGAFLVSGILAWARRPENRMGRLMVLTGVALLARQLRYSDDALLFTVFFILGDVAYAMVGHTALAYPTGRVTDRWERALVVAGYTTVLVFPFLAALFYDGSRPLLQFDLDARDSLINVTGNAHAVELLQKTEIVIFFGILASLFIVLVARRYWHASPRMRTILAPLLLAAVAFGLRAVFECVITFVGSPLEHNNLFWWQVTAFFLLPVALLVGLLRAHLARLRVGDLVLELEHTQPSELRDALARSLGDPDLELGFWLPERQMYADASGLPVVLPGGEDRTVTMLEHDGQPLAALVYDPSLLEEPELVSSVSAAARLALENARLQAETRAQLAEVKESRKRIVAAADEERKRIERDLHDGAQQRLSALQMQLRTAQLRLAASGAADPAVGALLESAVAEARSANEELRELVRGVYPPILTEDGLAAAVESLALRNPIPVELDLVESRFPTQVEATAYFVTCESLNNVLKHANASSAVIRITETRGLLRVEVVDDGDGGAHPTAGSGLSGLRDRVEALGGRLRVESEPRLGTRVVAEIPCAS
jgi:signal transduction histidine kinase